MTSLDGGDQDLSRDVRPPDVTRDSVGDILDWTGDTRELTGDTRDWIGDTRDWTGETRDLSGEILDKTNGTFVSTGDILD